MTRSIKLTQCQKYRGGWKFSRHFLLTSRLENKNYQLVTSSEKFFDSRYFCVIQTQQYYKMKNFPENIFKKCVVSVYYEFFRKIQQKCFLLCEKFFFVSLSKQFLFMVTTYKLSNVQKYIVRPFFALSIHRDNVTNMLLDFLPRKSFFRRIFMVLVSGIIFSLTLLLSFLPSVFHSRFSNTKTTRTKETVY